MTGTQDQSRISPTAALRDAFGAFATGVTVVTTTDADGRSVGFTANSFTSVSLDPALLLVCLAKSSSNLTTFLQAESFAVNILSADQADISQRFASRGLVDRFEGVVWEVSPLGSPLIKNCSAWFDCRRHDLIDAGDHLILIGKIEEFERCNVQPLIWLSGNYLPPSKLDGAVGCGKLRAGALLSHMDKILLCQQPSGEWTLPICKPERSFRSARLALEADVARAGIAAEWGFLYSIFDTGTARDDIASETFAFFLGELMPEHKLPAGMRLMSMDEIPFEEITIPGLRGMLQRYAQEHRSSRFGIYVDAPGPRGHVATFDAKQSCLGTTLKEQDAMQ